MTTDTSNHQPATIVCADWSKDVRKRAVWVAEVGTRTVRRLEGQPWTVNTVLEAASDFATAGPVLATFDAPIGVPGSYLAAVSISDEWRNPKTFIELLAQTEAFPSYFDPASSADEWDLSRPFFRVPPGKGGLTSFQEMAATAGVDLRRGIEKETRGKTVFAKSGIPGSVGSAAADLWQELRKLLAGERDFRIWPFEGELPFLLRPGQVVVGEIYPRAAYATAFLDGPACVRPRVSIAKTFARIRNGAIAKLQGTLWTRREEVVLLDLDHAQRSEDDFDACLTAAALLRCVLEGLPLSSPLGTSAASEGSILGSGTINTMLPEFSMTFLPTEG